jgi:hypothetical protein
MAHFGNQNLMLDGIAMPGMSSSQCRFCEGAYLGNHEINIIRFRFQQEDSLAKSLFDNYYCFRILSKSISGRPELTRVEA